MDALNIGTEPGERELRHRDDALQAAALAVSSARGDAVFQELTRYLATILGVQVALIGRLTDKVPRTIRTLGIYGGGAYRENFEYLLELTPCRQVVSGGFSVVPSDLARLFPEDEFLPKGAVGYAGYPLCDPAGRPIGVVAVISREPIADRALFESALKIFAVRAGAELERRNHEEALSASFEALRASEEQYRAIFNAAADSMVLRDAGFRVVDVNPAYEKMSGRTRAEALGRDALTMSPPELNEHVKGLHRRALAGEPVMFEARARRKDGSRFDIETRGVPIHYQGRPHVLYIGRDITAKKTEEELLRASEEQYRAIFDASADALVLWDSELRRVDVNPAYERIFGYSREEVLSGADAHRLPPDYERRRREIVRRTLAGERCHVELESRRKDGTLVQVEVRSIPVRHRGRPHVLAVCADVTERRRAEERLRASEERYRLLFEMESDAILLVDAETLAVIDMNPRAEALWGYTRAELLAMKATDISAEPDATRASVQEPSGPLTVPVRWHRRKDGTVFPIEITANRFVLHGRKTILAAIRDITERLRAEAAVRASEEQYRLLFEMESDAIVLVDVETLRHLDVNRAAVDLYGYSRAELLELKSTDLSAESEETRAAMRAGAAQAKGFVRVPLRWHRKKDGRVFPVEITANFLDLHGRRMMIAAIRDITERKRAEEARSQLEAQLRQAQKMEAIGQLTGGIAHDFNNILQSVLGNLTLAAERVEELGDARLARYLERAQLSAQRARELIQQMLTFSRGRRGEPRLVALAPLIAEAAKLLRPTLPSTLDFSVALEPDAPAAMLDPVQLDQVLLNLCINARDAMHGEGGLTVRVREARESAALCSACRGRFSGRFAEVAVADSGPGIAPEVAERMFEPFFSTKEVGKGSGMGLSTVHGIVHEHGGHVVVETAPGAGATFRVLFPAVAGEAAPQPTKPEAKARPRLAGRVLVVEDEEMVREFLADLLTGWGLEVTLAANGLEGKHAFAAEPQSYELVLTDQTMPRVSGLELARQIHAIRPGTPVVLYTGYGEDIGEAELAACGVRALAKKPVEPAELFALLKTHLQQSRNTLK